MKFDDFLTTINDWGRFQKLKYLTICLTYMLPPIMVYTYSFTAAIPNFRCRNPSTSFDDSFNSTLNEIYYEKYRPQKDECAIHKKSLSLKECQRCFLRTKNSSLRSCDDYIYEKSYYQQTLTEEVCFFSNHWPMSTKDF